MTSLVWLRTECNRRSSFDRLAAGDGCAQIGTADFLRE
jgi:hypothetical protein